MCLCIPEMFSWLRQIKNIHQEAELVDPKLSGVKTRNVCVKDCARRHTLLGTGR